MWMCFSREGTQPQTHPNIDKGLFGSQRVIGMKQAERPFPVNTDVGVLKWRFVTEDESMVPLMSKLTITYLIRTLKWGCQINCWEEGNYRNSNIEMWLSDQLLRGREF